MHDVLVYGRHFWTFNVVDDFNREPLTIEIDLNISAERVVQAQAQWAEEHGVMLEFFKSGKMTHNAFIERINRTYRTEILNLYLFRTLNEMREFTERWLNEYNVDHRHESLNNLTLEEYRLIAESGNLKEGMELKRRYLQLKKSHH